MTQAAAHRLKDRRNEIEQALGHATTVHQATCENKEGDGQKQEVVYSVYGQASDHLWHDIRKRITEYNPAADDGGQTRRDGNHQASENE